MAHAPTHKAEDLQQKLDFERDDIERSDRLGYRVSQGGNERRVPVPTRRAATAFAEPITISSSMPLGEISRILANHSCKDVTQDLDLDKCGTLPIHGGGFGDVYEGRLTNGQKVAIKSARLFICSREGFAQTTKDLARELYTWSKCNHPNILELHGLAHYNKQIATVSPWMENGTLPYFVNKNKPNIDIRSLMKCHQVSSGVEYLHEMGVVHGDIKGTNVLIAKDGTARLADFGNTILRSYSLRFSGKLTDSALSVRWTAPELLSGTSNTILEGFTGEVPFQDKSETSVLVDVMLRGKVPERPEALHPRYDNQNDALWELLLKCWNARPNERPTAKEIREHLST
ncbi:unnamed protein product [Rhizoctonia solani]|uniref:Protein kinase domain-containing protein n=1 Tax=Rhizoctonia solani TaxID=456999 RepID=A0A8H3A6L2_9AGAM|nr:unnamed protein product [Rhizoctonia solani]